MTFRRPLDWRSLAFCRPARADARAGLAVDGTGGGVFSLAAATGAEPMSPPRGAADSP